MTRSGKILFGRVLGVLWAILTVATGAAVFNIPIFALQPTLYLSFLGPGLVLALLLLVDAGRTSEMDGRVIKITVRHLVLALALWPAIGFLAADDGPGLLLALSLSFVLSSLLFWVGCGRSVALESFGWTSALSSTLLGLIWAVAVWFV